MTKAISITRDQLAAMNPCGLDARLKLFGRRKSLTAKQAFAAGATIRDLLWVAARLGHKDKCVRFALACAQRAAHPNPDPRVQTCLDATGHYLEFPSAESLAALRRARADAATAAAAYAYAYAYAAAAAAYAAYAAYAAAAADAADAAYAAAAAAADAYSFAAAADAYSFAAHQKEIAAQQALFIDIFGG